MCPLRVQPVVNSGTVLLRVRNALEAPIVLSKALLLTPDDETRAVRILPAPLALEPGAIHVLDVTHSVIDLLKPLPFTREITKRIKLRLLLEVPTSALLYEADCMVRIDRGQLAEFCV